jgi:hypothetical protein
MALKGMCKAYAQTLESFILQLEHRHDNALHHHINTCHANIGANKKNGNGKNTTSKGKTTRIQSLHKSSLLYAPHVLGNHIAESEEGGGRGEGRERGARGRTYYTSVCMCARGVWWQDVMSTTLPETRSAADVC